MKRWLAKLPS